MTKKEMVLEHLKKYKTITPKEAYFEYGSMRLGAIIFDLRKHLSFSVFCSHFISLPLYFGN